MKKIENPELRGRPPHQLQLPTSRSHSLKQSKPHKTARFSWNMQDVPDLKDSKYRGSMSSLASMDLGSGSVTPTPSTTKDLLDISAKDLAARPTVLHSGNLELKKTSGFKSYKRYWAVLDLHFLYIYGREKDSKAKQIYDVSGCIVTESNDLTNIDSSKEHQKNASFRESLKKRGGRTFELILNSGETRGFAASSKEDTEEWMKKFKEASINKIYEESIEVSDHTHVQAVEQDYEDEVMHEVLETSASSGGAQQEVQEWKVALTGHSRQHSRYFGSVVESLIIMLHQKERKRQKSNPDSFRNVIFESYK